MLRVSNQACIRELSKKSFRAAKTRNLIAILAIALTTMLFTVLFTVGLSMNEAIQQANFRLVGSCSHGGLKGLTEEQFLTLREDSLIQDWGANQLLGIGRNNEFAKNHVEVWWKDAKDAEWSYLTPSEGRLPAEGTNEAAADLEVLRLLGVEPKLGAEFTLSIDVGGQQTEQTFLLSGWWEKDPIAESNMVLVPESRVDSVFSEIGKDASAKRWNMNLMFKHTTHIEEDLNTVLSNHGYQGDAPNDENYIKYSVNWSFTGAKLSQKIDPTMLVTIAALLLLIVFTGYLIIYNVFQISVVNDIRYYGLLKTIGTTGSQIKSILRRQALALCLFGIPLGCLCGWGIGAWLSPVIMSRLNGFAVDTLSVSPMIFLCSAVFALITVLISCARPGRLAAKVSPVDAVRYTEGIKGRKTKKKGIGQVSVLGMAWANLGRSKGKTAITIVSLTLALVLLQMTAVFTNGFDMDKYLGDTSACDYILADGRYFKNNVYHWDEGSITLPEEVISEVTERDQVLDGGRIYGQLDSVQEFAPEDWVRGRMQSWGMDEESISYILDQEEHTPDGRVMDHVMTYGMEPFALDALTVVEGDLSMVYESGSRAVAAVLRTNDRGEVYPDSHWAKVGDTITLRYPTEWECYNPDTGEIYANAEDAGDHPYLERPTVYRDETVTVAALVLVPNHLSYRFYGSDEFVLNADTFRDVTGKSDVMLYAFDTKDGTEGEMDAFLKDYTSRIDPKYGYESKQTYMDEFESFRTMFRAVGGLLSFVVGMVGVLNFVNAVLTGILTRKRELAMLQSIGMTGKQLKKMLVWEGLFYALGAVAVAFVLSAGLSPLVASMLEHLLWFFTYKPTFVPLSIVGAVYMLIGSLVPLVVYRRVAKQTIVERLRESET